MKVKDLKKYLNELPDDDIIIATKGNGHPDFKITHVNDSTVVGVWEIRLDDFETNDYWEN